MAEILRANDVIINDKKYQIQTVDLTCTPLGSICAYEQVLIPYEKDGTLSNFGWEKLNTSETEAEALAAHEFQIELYKEKKRISKYY